ncbi:MAG: substrate-binding periplasmic protein, partial [Inhella sp.]
DQGPRRPGLLPHILLDLVLAATPTDERRTYAAFTPPYREERIALLGLADETPPLRDLNELKGRQLQIGVIRGTAFPPAMSQTLEDPALQALLLPLRANELSLAMLRARRIAYVIDDPITILHRAAAEPGPAVHVVLPFPDSPVHGLLSQRTLDRHPQLLARLDQGLGTTRQHPSWKQVLRRYPGA